MRTLLIIALICASLAAQATNYYVKNGGSDAADGLSDGTAWATINKVNTSISAGDSVFFKRGSLWREQLIPITGSSGSHTYYGAYGTGDKPLILGSIEMNQESDWTNVSGNIWRTGTGTFTLDVGNLIFDGEDACGVKIMSATPTLDSQGEFWYDYTNDRIELYSVGNPATVYTDIECAIKQNQIHASNKSYLTFQNLDVRYGAAHGIGTSSGHHHFHIVDCDFSFIGGGDQSGDYTTRYGNGVEFWAGSHDVTVERCRFDNIYDAAISPQGDVGTYEVYNHYYKNNLITNSEYSYEIFWHDATAYAHDIYFENNTCLWAGGGWGHDQRSTKAGQHVRMGQILCSTTSNVVIRNNIFHGATERIIYYHNATELAKTTLDYNNYYVYPGGAYAYRTDGGATSYYSLASWQSASGQEAHAVDGNPSLADTLNYDYHLTSGSNVRGKGIYSPYNQTDFDQVDWKNPPSIGAFEFTDLPTKYVASNDLVSFRGDLVTHSQEAYHFPASIAWFSDFHYGSTSWTQQELDEAVIGLNTHEVELYYASGDQIEHTGDPGETAAYLALMEDLSAPLHNLRGNHDGSQFTQHFVIEVENVVIIAFYASYYALPEPPAYNNTGHVSETELAWIETQLQTYAGKRIILSCHYPMTDTYWGHIIDGHGREEIVQLMDAYGVKLYLSGHVHGGWALTDITDTNDTQEINSAAGGYPGSFSVITIHEDRIVFTPYSLASPYGATTPVHTLYF